MRDNGQTTVFLGDYCFYSLIITSMERNYPFTVKQRLLLLWTDHYLHGNTTPSMCRISWRDSSAFMKRLLLSWIDYYFSVETKLSWTDFHGDNTVFIDRLLFPWKDYFLHRLTFMHRLLLHGQILNSTETRFLKNRLSCETTF